MPDPPPVAPPVVAVNPPPQTSLPEVSQSATAAAAAPELGRGGNQHKEIQKRLKTAAEALGFRAIIEHTILEGAGSVDLAISRADVAIACEITITTTVDQEVGNVAKCIKAGYPRIAVVSVSAERLKKIEEAVRHGLGEEVARKVMYFLPDEFIASLKEIPLPPPPEPAVKELFGYKVKKKYPQLTPEEREAKERQAIDALAALMKRKP